MRVYEMMIIFDSDVDDSGIQQMLNRVNDMVAAGGGKVATTDRWGRRRFAYEINHKQEGYYVVLEIVTEGPNLDDVDRFLRIADQVVRHKTLRLPEHEATRRGLLGQKASA
ncbi:MAG: 30S ribosomal protein S6 [Actinobacteria bacterium]|nr:30S ribosomal protein S6 [Actinomycetota bacterium]